MGSALDSFKKDSNIDIYLELASPVYTAGTMIEGNVYLNVKGYSQYDALYIRLEGKQYLHWSQGSGKNRRSYSNSRDSYSDEFILAKFNGSIQPGHYTFPFSLLLPSSLSGSFFISGNNYIMYPLTCYLTSFQGKNENQPFAVKLNINQPLRNPYGMIQTDRNIQSKCCGCCADYGIVNAKLQCDKNFAMTGDEISILGHIDNTRGKAPIENAIVSLNVKKIMVSSGGRTNNHTLSSRVLFDLKNRNPTGIKQGNSQSFNFTSQIPADIQYSTAIGNITAIWFQIKLLCLQGCCNYSQPGATLHIIVHSRQPVIVQKQKIQPPVNWNPLVSQPVYYANMKPYIYNPVTQIPIRNIPDGQNVMNLGNMGNMGNNQGIPPQYTNNQTDMFINNNEAKGNQAEKYGY